MEKKSKNEEMDEYQLLQLKKQWTCMPFDNDKWLSYYKKYGNTVATEYAKSCKPYSEESSKEISTTLGLVAQAMGFCRESIREPRIVIFNPNFFKRAMKEHPNLFNARVDVENRTVLGLNFLIDSRVKDFLIFPKMSWKDQIWKYNE